MSEKSSISPRSVSYTSIKEAVRSSGKGLALPLLKNVDSFHKISIGDERASKSVNENARSSEQIASAQAEVNYAESFPNKSRLSSCAPKANCIEALESINKGFFEPQHQEGPEMDLRLVGMPSFVEESKEAEKDRRNSSTASSHHEISFVEAPQELPTDAGSEKVVPKGSKVREWLCKDKEPEDGEFEGMKEDVEDLDEDHEVSPMPSDVALNFYLLY